jgi:hypothetical protein
VVVNLLKPSSELLSSPVIRVFGHQSLLLSSAGQDEYLQWDLIRKETSQSPLKFVSRGIRRKDTLNHHIDHAAAAVMTPAKPKNAFFSLLE